ncbi:Ion channel [Dirofilaria immitis]|nr:Ion channel [Dirofilaria immitis]
MNLTQSMQMKTIHGKNQISDDKIGLINNAQTPTILLQTFNDEKGSSMLFGEDNSMVIDSSIRSEKRRRRRKRRRTLEANNIKQKIEQSKITKIEKTTGGRTIWRNIIWLIILFAYSFIGGIVFSAIEGYGNFHPATNAGRIISMIYAFCGIPLVFTILLEWGFLYYTWLDMFWKWFNIKFCTNAMKKHQKRRLEKEKSRRAGSDLSLRLTSLGPLTQLSHKHDDLHQTDHQLPIELSDVEKQRTVPLKAAFIFFFLWILISAFFVRLWETNWTYFTAYYYFFTSLTTIGLGDVVTETPNYIIFNLALTMIGLSVVGLCVSIVQAKIRLIFDRMIRSIDSQYRIRQIDPDVATMIVIPNEKEGIKRLCEAQPIQDRLIYIAMDEHKKQLLEDRWRQRSSMVNRIIQTRPNRTDKCIQTGQRVDDQPPVRLEKHDDWESGSSTLSDEDGSDYDPFTGKRIVPPSARRYIYTVFD